MNSNINTILASNQDINNYIPFIYIFFALIIVILLVYLFYTVKMLKQKSKYSQVTFDLAIASAHLLILRIDRNGRILNFNHNFADLFQFTHLNHNESLLELFNENNKRAFFRLLESIRNGLEINNFEMTLQSKDGKDHHILWTSTGTDPDSLDAELELIGFNITERVELERQLRRTNKDLSLSKDELTKQNILLEENQKKIWNLAYVDSLTSLYNRTYFIERANEILSDDSLTGALLTIDIDNIGYCNNIFGFSRTDEIIIDLATRIYKMTRKNQLVAKLGSDEFGILLTNMSKEEIKDFVAEIVEVNTHNISYEGVTLHVSVSIGVCFFPDDGNNYESLIQSAGMALQYAKKNGKGQYAIYSSEMEKQLKGDLAIEALLREGLNNEMFFLVYQPQYNIKSGEISGFEALLRLRDNSGNIIPPNKFIYIAEETKLIIPIGYWVVHQACEFILKLNEKGIKNLTVSINVSVVQLLQDDFVQNVKGIINKYNIEPAYFEIEITETSLMHFDSRNLTKIKELRDFGINIALDDFGTGYSSLLYFKKATNISILKIDREFVNDLTLNDNSSEIVDAIIYLAHKFNFVVVAEGVETQEQLKILYNLDCDIMQGYLGSKPMPEDIIFESFATLSSKFKL